MAIGDRSSSESGRGDGAHLPLHNKDYEQPSLLDKMRHFTLKVSRRHVVILTVVISCVFFLRSSQPATIIRKPQWLPQNVFSCDSARSSQNSHIAPPEEPDHRALTTLWGNLYTSFIAHSVSPHFLDRPPADKEADDVAKIRELILLAQEEADATRAAHAAMVDEIPNYPSELFKGTGIVTLAGGHFSEFAATSLGMVREVGSKLPIEIWAIDEEEERAGWCEELRNEGIACRKLSDYVDVKALQHPYQYKVLTILLSSFENVLFLDADSFPLWNPDPLFETDVYKRYGAIMWPDYWMSVASGWTTYILGLSEGKDHQFTDVKTAESGQILWDKKRHWRSLVLASYYNFHGPNFYYTLISANYAGWGDKDTFTWAMRALHEDYFLVPHDIVTVFHEPNANTADKDPYGIGMAQADPTRNDTNVPFFLHNNIIKWSLRDFMCVKCTSIWTDKQGNKPAFKSSYEDSGHSIYQPLHEGKRILRTDTLLKHGIDPEPLIWKQLEHTACRSKAWGSKQLCEMTRKHMRLAFGFEFQQTHIGSATGTGQEPWELCVIDPPGKNYTVPNHPTI